MCCRAIKTKLIRVTENAYQCLHRRHVIYNRLPMHILELLFDRARPPAFLTVVAMAPTAIKQALAAVCRASVLISTHLHCGRPANYGQWVVYLFRCQRPMPLRLVHSCVIRCVKRSKIENSLTGHIVRVLCLNGPLTDSLWICISCQDRAKFR